MPRINCSICSHRTDNHKQRRRIGTVWPLVQKHAEEVNWDISRLSKEDFICMKCHSKVSHFRMTDRGPNKKIKISEPIVLETIINKQVLRGYVKPVEDTPSNMEVNNTITEEVNDEVLPMSTDTVVDDEIHRWTLPAKEITGAEAMVTTNEVDLISQSSVELMGTDTIEPIEDSHEDTNDEHVINNLRTCRTESSLSHQQLISSDETVELIVDAIDNANIVSSVVDDFQSCMTNGVQNGQQSSMSSKELQNNKSIVTFQHIHGTKSTQARCFICDSVAGRNAVPWAAIQQVWFEKKCYVPKSNRTCDEHLNAAKMFNEEALRKIEATKQSITVKISDFELWFREISYLPKSMLYNFNNDGIVAEKYKMLCGISKENFDDLVTYLSGMRNTEARSVRDALAMFLLLLRNNMKQEVIAHNFSTSQQGVSKTIDTVSAMLHETFVPLYLGYRHITREEALQRHSIKLTSNVLGESESRLFLISDCTYNYIEKPSDFELQRKTFCLHKKRNLLKPLYIVFPNGYILEAAGPYFSDAKNNDAANIREHYKNSELLLFMEDDDCFIFDRGFRDVVQETTTNGKKVFMPCLLGGKRTHFTCDEANESRKVTMSRWVVESVNARIKNVFPWFKHMIEGTYVPKIIRFNRIACAILNKYFPPLTINKEFHELMADVSVNQTVNINQLKEEIESLGIQRMSARWKKASESTILDFPKLSMVDLKRITLGTYQIKTAEKYIEQHMKESGDFGIFIHRENEDILRAKIQSRFSKAKTHNTWVKFDKELNGYDAIKGLYCTCKVGERTLGCCSHLATVVRYLGFDRHEPPKPRLHPRAAWDAIDCDQERNNDSSGDEEDPLGRLLSI